VREPQRRLAHASGFDLAIEDHGFLVLYGTFEYEGSWSQGLGYQVDVPFLKRFLGAFGVERLQQVNGRTCYVTSDGGRIHKIEPLPWDPGKSFDINEWRDEKEQAHADALLKGGTP
jgi:hypothetical protein